MDVLGLGVLIAGESGIGKSECALDLIVRGHRLVADDTVEVRRRAETILIGTCPELTRHHMELRGLGVINVKDLFGIASTRSSKRVELVVQLERWDAAPRVRAPRAGRRVLRDPGPARAAHQDAGRARTQHCDSRRSGGAQPAAARARTQRRPHPRRSARTDAAADVRWRRSRRRRGRRGDRGRRRSSKKTRKTKQDGDGEKTIAGRRPREEVSRASVHHPDRAVRIGQVAGDSCARRSRLLLRRQPADHADSDARQVVAPRRRSKRSPSSSTCARATFSRRFPKIFRRAPEDAATEPRPDLPRGQQRHAGPAIQRDPAAAPAGAGSVGQRRHPRRSARG